MCAGQGHIDLVTDADKASEAYVVGRCAGGFPNTPSWRKRAGRLLAPTITCRVIDPLDGTTNFAHGFRHFCVSIALVKGGDAVLGVVYDPLHQECYAAEKGSGAFLNGQRIQVSKTETVLRSLLASGFPYDVATSEVNNLEPFCRVMKASQAVRSLGAAALDLCQVAAGRLDAFWELVLEPWDLAAGGLIVQEAGGKVTDCTGGKFNPLGTNICASNGLIHAELLGLIQG